MTTAGKWDQFIPDVGLETRKVLEGGLEIIADLGIVDAYTRWCGKSVPDVGSRTESIMVSCPNPAHPDKIPSAWLNSEKNVYFCGSCQEGGDIMDLAAYKFGFPIPGYKQGRSFPQLIETCLIDLGYDVEAMKVEAGIEIARAIEAEPIVTIVDPEFEEVYADNGLDWKEFAPEGTFLHKWMTATTQEAIPDEFLFFLGLQMVSLAAGRHAWVMKGTPIYSNLMLALMGKTGSGKSRGIRIAERLIDKALPFDKEDPTTLGVKMISRPGSGEVLIDAFSWLPASGSTVPLSVNGWVTMDELAELMKATNRKGGTLREIMLQMYDGKGKVSVMSRGHGDTIATDPFFNFAVGAQPDAIGGMIESGDVSTGFTNRFMYVSGTPKPRKPWAEIEPIDLGSLHIDLLNIANAYASKPTGIMLDLPAEDRMDECLAWTDTLLEREGDMFGRLELHLIKLTMLLVINERIDIAGVEHVDKAKKLVEFLLPTTKIVDDETGVSNVSKMIKRIEEIVTSYKPKKGKHPSASDISRNMSPKMRKDRDGLNRVLDTLVRQGHLMEAPRTEEDILGGLRVKRYMLPIDGDMVKEYAIPEDED